MAFIFVKVGDKKDKTGHTGLKSAKSLSIKRKSHK